MAHYKGAASEAGRAMQLLKKREQAQMEIEFRKKKIEEDLKISNIENKFAAHYDAVEQQLKTSTIGLVTLDEMKAKQENIVKERERKLAQKQAEKEREQQRQLEAKQAEKNRQRKQNADIYTDSDGESTDGPAISSEMGVFRKKRKNKNRPQELSSKVPVKSKLPRVQRRIDPRFDSLCGTYDEKSFKTAYNFIDDIRQKEKKQLAKLLKKEGDPERRKQIRYLIERTTNQEMAKKKIEQKQKQAKELRDEYIQSIAEGNPVAFPRKDESMMKDLLNDFDDLDKAGKLMKYMKRKSKKLKKHSMDSFQYYNSAKQTTKTQH